MLTFLEKIKWMLWIKKDISREYNVRKDNILYLFVRIKNKLLNRYYLYYNEAIVRLTVR